MQHSKSTLQSLEIFWNEKSKKPRSRLTDFLAAYIEIGDIADPLFTSEMHIFHMRMTVLHLQGLVKRENYEDQVVWSLTTEGHVALLSQHPRLKIFLQNFIESSPALLVILSGVIGFVASVAGLIQFYKWVFP